MHRIIGGLATFRLFTAKPLGSRLLSRPWLVHYAENDTSWGFVELEEMVVELEELQARNRGVKRTFVNPAGRLDNSNISSVIAVTF